MGDVETTLSGSAFQILADGSNRKRLGIQMPLANSLKEMSDAFGGTILSHSGMQ